MYVLLHSELPCNLIALSPETFALTSQDHIDKSGTEPSSSRPFGHGDPFRAKFGYGQKGVVPCALASAVMDWYGKLLHGRVALQHDSESAVCMRLAQGRS